MSMRISQKEHVNIPHDIERATELDNHSKTFLTDCANELKSKGTTICFKKWQIDELRKKFPDLKVEKKEGWYYVVQLQR